MTERAGRYRALQRLDSRFGVETWRGLDQRLGRPVTVRVVRDPHDNSDSDPDAQQSVADPDVAPRLKSQVRSLARLEHIGLLHVLDTCAVDGGFAIVTEEFPTRTVADELAVHGHLSQPRATEVVRQVAPALQALHDHGFAHGGVTAEHLGIRPDESIVILDGPPTSDAVMIPARPADDTKALAELMHLLVAGGMPRIGHDRSVELHPEISHELHPVLERALSTEEHLAWGSVQAFADSLPTPPRVRPVRDDHRHSFLRAERAWFLPVMAIMVIALAVVGWALIAGRSSDPSDDSSGSKGQVGVETSAAAGAPNPDPTTAIDRRPSPAGPLDVIDIADFDPTSDDRAEHSDRIEFINDGDNTRGWQTERYTSADFGNLKPGVGLIAQLGPPQLVNRILVSSPSIGWGVQIYVAAEPPASISDWGEAVAVESAINGDAVIELDGLEAATLLVWIVNLGEETLNGGHRVTITGLSVSGRPVFG
ncbi:MAG: hypothetical protein ACI8Y4_001495 [Candidatus Poriferisodalaceae bacterium]